MSDSSLGQPFVASLLSEFHSKASIAVIEKLVEHDAYAAGVAEIVTVESAVGCCVSDDQAATKGFCTCLIWLST